MCRGIDYVHEGCKHIKKFHVVQVCNSYNGTPCHDLITIHEIKITAPAFCLRCFHRKEAAIDAEYEIMADDLRNEIARVDECFAKGWVPTQTNAHLLNDYRAECEDDVLQAKASRDLSIQLFRQDQGVWGDG